GDEDKAVEVAQEEITNFKKLYQDYWLSGMRAKLGIFNKEVEDGTLVNDLLEMMKKWGADYTNTFRALTLHTFDEIDLLKSAEFMKWHQTWQSRLDRQQESNDSSLELMHGHNPAIITRNHRSEEHTSELQSRFDLVCRLL